MLSIYIYLFIIIEEGETVVYEEKDQYSSFMLKDRLEGTTIVNLLRIQYQKAMQNIVEVLFRVWLVPYIKKIFKTTE